MFIKTEVIAIFLESVPGKCSNWIDFVVFVEELLVAICRTVNYYQLSRDNRIACEPVSDIGLM